MQALRVTLESATACFRVPNINNSVQLTYPVPPPATIYGLLGAAVGSEIAPARTRFAYSFRSESQFVDLMRSHMAYTRKKPAKDYTPKPYTVEVLGDCQLVLYLTDLSLESVLLRPQFPLRLGRTEDLATLTDLRLVDLEPADSRRCALANTLVTEAQARQIGGWSTMLRMAKYADQQRNFVLATYATVTYYEQTDDTCWCDGSREVAEDVATAVAWLSFI